MRKEQQHFCRVLLAHSFLGQHLLTVCVAADGTRGEPNFNFMSIQEMSEGRDFHCEDAAELKEEEGGGGGRREGGG